MSKNKKKKKKNIKSKNKKVIKSEERQKVKEIKQEEEKEKNSLAQEMYAIAKAVLEKKEEKKKEKAKRFENIYCKKIKDKLKKAALNGDMYIIIRREGALKNADFDEIEKYFKNEGFAIRRYGTINFDEIEISFEKLNNT